LAVRVPVAIRVDVTGIGSVERLLLVGEAIAIAIYCGIRIAAPIRVARVHISVRVCAGEDVARVHIAALPVRIHNGDTVAIQLRLLGIPAKENECEGSAHNHEEGNYRTDDDPTLPGMLSIWIDNVLGLRDDVRDLLLAGLRDGTYWLNRSPVFRYATL